MLETVTKIRAALGKCTLAHATSVYVHLHSCDLHSADAAQFIAKWHG